MAVELATAWVTIAANTSGMRRDIRRALTEADRDRSVRFDADTRPMQSSLRSAFAAAAIESRLAGRRIGQNMGQEAGSALSRQLKIAVGAVGVGSLPAVSSALGTVAASLQQVTQAGLVVPGVVAGAAASLGTLKLGTVGVADAAKAMWEAAASGDPKDLKKAADAMKDLSPNAKATITAVGGLRKELTGLQSTVQNNMFAGLDRDVKTLATRTLPTLTAGLEKTSRAWNGTFRELARVGGDSSTTSILDRVFGNTADAQNRANRAIAPMTAALGQLAATGTDSLPRIADGLGSVSNRFNAFISTAASDGRLNTWINEGINGVTHLGNTTLNVGKAFTALTQAAGGGEGFLNFLDKGSGALEKFMNSDAGQEKLSAFFSQGRAQLAQWSPILTSLPTLFNAVYQAANTFTSAVLPPLGAFARLLAEHVGLVKTAALAWLAFRTIPGIIAGLQARLAGLALSTNQVTGQTRTVGSAMAGMAGTIRAAASANQTLVASNGAVLGSGRQLTGHINNWNNGAAAMARSMGQSAVQFGRFGSAVGVLGTRLPVLANMQQAFVQSATAAERFGRTSGAVSAAGAAVTSSMSGIGKAAGGVIGALGGPWGAAFAAAGIAAMAIVSQNQKSAQSFKAVQDSIRSTAQARAELTGALLKSRGAVTDDVKSQVDDNVSEIDKALSAAASRRGSFLDDMRAEGQGLFSFDSMFGGTDRTQAQAIEEEANKAKDAQKAIDGLKYSKQGLRDVAIGSQSAFEAFTRKLEAAGDGGKEAASKFRDMRVDFMKQQEAARALGPGIRELSTAFDKMNDSTASSADRLNAIKTAMEALSPAATATEAVGQYAEKVKELTDAAAGIGPVITKADGTLDGFDANSKKLAESLRDLAVKSADVAANGSLEDIGKMAGRNAELFKAWAAATGRPVAEIEKLYSTYGGKAVDLSIAIKGAPEATRSLALLGAEFDRVPGRKTVQMETSQIESARGQIERLGFSIKEVAGSDGQRVEITANTEQARLGLAGVLQQLTSIPPGKAIDVSAPGGQAVLSLLKAANVEVTSHNGKDIEVSAPNAPGVKQLLEALNLTTRTENGKTILVTQTGVEKARDEQKGLTEPATKVITIRQALESGAKFGDTLPNGQVLRGPGIATNAYGSIRQYAHGGIQALEAYANGGFSGLPKQALIQRADPRGGLVQWAEPSTAGEAFIPLAGSKRGRSRAIWWEVGRRLGMTSFADGGLRPGAAALKNIIASKFGVANIGGYRAEDGYGEHSSGRALDVMVGNDSAKGDAITQFAIANASKIGLKWVIWKQAMHYPDGRVEPMEDRGSPTQNHMDHPHIFLDQSSDKADFAGLGGDSSSGSTWNSLTGLGGSSSTSGSGDSTGSGGSGSFRAATDKELTSAGKKVTTAQSGVKQAEQSVSDKEFAVEQAKRKLAELDGKKTSESQRLAAERRVTVAERELTDSKDRLTKAQNGLSDAQSAEEKLRTQGVEDAKSKSGNDQGSQGQSLGQGIFSGFMQSMGFDGSLFSNPFEWPNVKSAVALANWGGGLAKGAGKGAGAAGGQSLGEGAASGVASGLGLNLSNVADFMKPIEPQKPITPAGPGMAIPIPQKGGDTYNISGVNPNSVKHEIDNKQNSAYRRQKASFK